MNLDLLASSCLSGSSQPTLPLCSTGMLEWVLQNIPGEFSECHL